MAIHAGDDLFARRAGRFFEERSGAEDHPRGTEATLQRLVLHEGGLQRVQRVLLAQPLDGDHLPIADRAHRREARPNRDAVAEYRARAAVPLATAILGPG